MQLDPAGAGEPVRTRLTSRDGICRHLTAQRRPLPPGGGRAAGQRPDRRDRRPAPGHRGHPARCRRRPTAAGSRRPPPSSGSTTWPTSPGGTGPGAGRRPRSPGPPPRTSGTVAVDDVFTPWADPGRRSRWPDLTTHLDIPLRADRIDLNGLADVRAATAAVDERAGTVGGSAASTIGPLLDSTSEPAAPGAQRHPAARRAARRARHRGPGVRLRRRHRAAPARDRAGPPARPRQPRRGRDAAARARACWCSPAASSAPSSAG